MRNKQSGTAIFLALMVVSIVAALSVAWFIKIRTSVQRTQQLLLSEQIYLAAEGVVDWGISALKIDDRMPKILPPTLIMTQQGVITGRLDDHQKTTDKPIGVAEKNAAASQEKEYFLLRTEVRLREQHLILYSLLHRKMVEGKIQVGVIWQSHGLN